MKRIMAGAALAVTVAAAPCWAQVVKITPLGTHDGELCSRDRATLFEDPSGVRILYDAGHSVMGAGDPRLGAVDVVLLTHAQQPAAVIASHPNEAVTTDGKLRPQSRTALFASLVKGRPVYLALSGRTMEFDGDAKCVSGCQ